MAPEVLFNNTKNTNINNEKVDVFSLGIILFRMITGVPESQLDGIHRKENQTKLLTKVKSSKKFIHALISHMIDLN